MKHFRLLTLVAILMIAALILTACPSSQTGTEAPAATEAPAQAPAATEPAAAEPTAVPMAELGTIKVGTNAEYPPFESVDENGNVIGFDIDIMNAIAKAAGFEVEFVNTRWDGIFVALSSGEFDAVASAATITDERKQAVDFSDPYFNAGQVLVVKKGSDITSVDDLAGKRVGVQLGTTGDIWSSENTQAEVVRYDEVTLAFQALGNGDVDAIINDAPTSADILKANPEIGAMIIGEPFTDEFYGIAVNKERQDVLKAINEGLAAIRASGEYDQIYNAWLGVPAAAEGGSGAAMAEGMSFGLESCDGFDGIVQKVVAVDDMTVEFDLCKPDPACLSKVAFSAFGIQPSEGIESTGGTGDLLDHPIGTGAYMLDSWNRGDSIVFKKNADYWGEPAMTDTLVFRWLTEGAGRLLELQSGTVDGIDNLSPDDFATVEADSNLQLLERPALNVFYVGMTDTFAPWDNVQVRQAIAKGIDRQRIVDTFYPAGSEVASHFTPCAIPNGCVGDDWYDFNVEEAKALLADAGFPDGFSTKIYYRDVARSYLPDPSLVAQDIQAQLKENLNIDASIEVMESGAFIAASSAGDLDGLYLLGWGADYPHITNFLDYHFGRANVQFGDPHPEIYDLLEKGGQIADPAESEAIYVDANNAIRELVPMVPIAHGGSGLAYLADVEGAQASPLGNEYMAAMKPGDRAQFVWMQNAEPISLYCGDETDGESLRACEQVTESLYAYEINGTAAQPALATSCDPNEDLTVWTCKLREGVTFHDGSAFDAKDVLASWQAGLDASSPTHVGNTGAFEYFSTLWGLMNVPAQ